MLLVVGDERGSGVALDLFGRAVALRGAPAEQVSSGRAVIGGWCKAPTISRGDGWILEGSAFFPAGDINLLERATKTRGDFAFMAADPNGVLLASGPAGGYRPIFVSSRPGRFVASTSLDAVCHLSADVELHPDMVAAHAANATRFSTVRSDASATLFANVRCVPMYEAWHVGFDGRVFPRQTFRPLDNPDAENSEADLVAQLREAFRAAVQRAMTGHRRVGVQVSGGLDSSSLLSVSHRLAQGSDSACSVEAFAWDYATHYGDDRPYLRSLSQHLGLEPHRIAPADAGTAVSTTFAADCAPFCGQGGPLLAAMSDRTRERGITVLLSGVGGDDILDGDPDLLAGLALAGHPLRAITRAVRLRGSYMGGPAWRVRRYVVQPMLRDMLPASVRRARREKGLLARYSWAGPRLRRWLSQAAASKSPSRPRLDWTAAARFEAMARSPFLAQFCLARGQEESIVCCVRRDPFFDDELLRTVAAIPPLALLSRNYKRGLFRESMRGFLPEDVRLRETKAIMEPALGETVAAAGGFRVLEPLADVRMLADLGIAEPRRFRAAFDDLARNPDRGPWIAIWPALATEAFLRQWDERRVRQ